MWRARAVSPPGFSPAAWRLTTCLTIRRRRSADSSIPAWVANSAPSGSRRFSSHGLSSNDGAAVPARIEQGHAPMSKHVTISPTEAADRLAIRELVEAYAHCADRRDAKGQMALFTAD